MSSLCHSKKYSSLNLVAALLAAPVLLNVTVASAADGYVVPELSVGGNYQSNIGLVSSADPAPRVSATGYSADAAAILGVRGRRWQVDFRPAAQFVDYPSQKQLRKTNIYLGLNNVFRSQRAEWELIGNYYRQSYFNSEQLPAQYNAFDPNDPTVDSKGQIRLIAESKSRLQLRPSFSYDLTERIGTEIKATYQTLRTDLPPLPDGRDDKSEDYDDYTAAGLLTWRFDQKTKFGAGIKMGRYENGEKTNRTNSTGLVLELAHRWSPTLSGKVTGNIQRATSKEKDETGAPLPDTTRNKWGIAAQIISLGQISNWRLDAGRTISPSSSGSRVVLDQLRVQYSRSVTPRVAVLAAGRFFRSRKDVPNGTVDSANRDYASGSLGASVALSRTWYIAAGYSPYWQRLQSGSGAAMNHTVAVTVGYRGLPPQQ